MKINGNAPADRMQAFAAQMSKTAKRGESFGSRIHALEAGKNSENRVNTQKTHIIYMKTDDMLYSGGNGTGLSYYLKYAPDSTEEDPTVIAKGVDENGNAFEQTIHINQISPYSATLVEMRALEAYLGVDKNGGLSSLPPDTGNMGLYDRRNFMDMFQKQIRDMQILKERQLVSYYQYSMQMYEAFLNGKSLHQR